MTDNDFEMKLPELGAQINGAALDDIARLVKILNATHDKDVRTMIRYGIMVLLDGYLHPEIGVEVCGELPPIELDIEMPRGVGVIRDDLNNERSKAYDEVNEYMNNAVQKINRKALDALKKRLGEIK